MKQRRSRLPVILLLFSLFLFGILGLLAYSEWRQRQHDFALVAAVERNDKSAVLKLLDEGANANAQKSLEAKPRLFWQSILALFRKRSGVGQGPSVLLLASQWRTDPLKNTADVLDNAAIVKALVNRGARFNGPEIMARMEQAYDLCLSYQDTGEVVATMPAFGFKDRIQFEIAFARPGQFLFAMRHSLPGSGFMQRHVVWRSEKDAYEWDSLLAKVNKTRIERAVAGATGISLSAAATCAGLLMPEEMGGWGGVYIEAPHLAEKETLGNVLCYYVSGKDSSGNVTNYWIDAQTFLLRQKQERNAMGTQTTTYRPQTNVSLSATRFRFVPSEASNHSPERLD